MDPQTEKNPGLYLPQPSAKTGEVPYGQYDPGLQRPEFALPEIRSATQPSPSPVASLPSPLVVPQAPVDNNGAATYASEDPIDDAAGDELDKEWVNKAKMIVEKTKDDPYMQSHEIGKVKADYLRIRYNKHIKVAQDKPL